MKAIEKKILVIGAGSIGLRHVRTLHALGGARLAVADPAPKDPALKDLGVSLYKDAREALRKEKPDVVFICTPTHRHVKDARLALEHGAHLFIEKPLSHTLVGVDALMRLAKQKKRVVMVACNYRLNEGFRRVQALLESGKLGKALTARVVVGFDLLESRGPNYRNDFRARRAEGGGVILDSGAHVVDYLRAFFGTVRSVWATYGNKSSLGLDAEDFVSAVLEYRTGAVVSLDMDFFSVPKRHSVEIQFERGWARWDFAGNTIEWYDAANSKYEILTLNPEARRRDDAKTQKEHRQAIAPAGQGRDMFYKEVEYFLAALERKHPVLQSLPQAKEVLQVLLAVKESGQKGKKISLQKVRT